MAGGRKRWFTEAAIYTLAGGLSSSLVGAVLGWLGHLIFPGAISRPGFLAAFVIGLLAIARELGWITLPLPELKRQTKGIWARLFSGKVAAALWGVDLGLIFTTRLTFAGVWLLAVLALLIGEPVFIATLFVFYWLGRALSVWLVPALMPDAGATSWVLDGIHKQFFLFQRIHVAALIWALIVLILWEV